MKYSKAGKDVDQINYARADASCVDCQTVAVAFQLVLVTKDRRKFAPRNRADSVNMLCEECLTWASAKQVIVATGGPATLSQAGQARMLALEARIEALEPDLPRMSLEALHGGAGRRLWGVPGHRPGGSCPHRRWLRTSSR